MRLGKAQGENSDQDFIYFILFLKNSQFYIAAVGPLTQQYPYGCYGLLLDLIRRSFPLKRN